jgi:cell division septal protein FtsQ
MAKKKRPQSRASSVRVKGRSSASRKRSEFAARSVTRFLLPLLICCVLAGVTLYLGMAGYRTATASDFFGLRRIEVTGNERTPAEDIRRIVTSAVERPGVWKADLSEIKAKVEKFPFVRTAAVSMVLPAGIRVSVTERVPAAVVHLSYGDFLVDGEGAMLMPAKPGDPDFPIALRGWDEAKTERAIPENIARIKLYRKMLDEWKQFDLVSRVKEVNLTNTREPTAVVEDSGRAITVMLAKDNLGRSLKTAIEALSGRGAKIKSIDVEGISPVIQYLDLDGLK